MSEELLVIGDVHGDARKLQAALDFAEKLPRRIVFVGDYIDRGQDSKSVIGILIELKKRRPSTVFLIGNHEISLLLMLDEDDRRCLTIGGMATMRSYLQNQSTHHPVRDFLRNFPTSHEDFIRSLTSHYESDSVLISHAGLNPADPHDRSLRNLALSSHPDLFEKNEFIFEKYIIFGHYIQSHKPHVTRHLACIDTGCGSRDNGQLTVFLWPEKRYKVFGDSDA